MHVLRVSLLYLYTYFSFDLFLSLGVLIQVLCLPRSYEAHSFLRASSVALFNIYRVYESKREIEADREKEREKE